MNILVDWFINKLFYWTPLRQAIFAEVHFYDQIEAALKEPTNNLAWEEGGKWYGYTLNEMHNLYLFDDIGHENMTDLWEDLMARNLEHDLSYR